MLFVVTNPVDQSVAIYMFAYVILVIHILPNLVNVFYFQSCRLLKAE